MIPFLRRPSAVLVIRRGVIALGGGVCAASAALILGLAARPNLRPLTAPAVDTRPTIIDGPPTNVEAAPPPVAPMPRLRRRRVEPSADEDADELEAAALAQTAPGEAAPAEMQGPSQAQPPAAQRQAAWPYRCAGLASPADRMVCASPRLNAEEGALQRLYGMALYRTDNPDALREEQRRWRAVRDQVAEAQGPEGLAELYAERMQELDGGPYY